MDKKVVATLKYMNLQHERTIELDHGIVEAFAKSIEEN